MFDFPTFNVPIDAEIAGDDPLGLAPTNERLYGDVFPGINNVVRYIRIYSSICWMVRRVELHFESKGTGLTRRAFGEALQKLQVAICWVNQGKGYLQIAGINRIFPVDDDPRRMVFDTFGQSTASLLDAVAYRPSLTNGLGFLEARMGGTFECTAAGRVLAEAFDELAKSSPEYGWLSDVEALVGRRSQVLELAELLDVGQPTEPEQRAFLGQFLPSDVLPDDDQQRLNRVLGIRLALRAVDAACKANIGRGQPGLASEDDVRACMARGRSSDGHALSLDGLESVQAWWAVLQVRQLQRLALDVLYCLAERWIGQQLELGRDNSIDACAAGIGASAVSGLADGHLDTVGALTAYVREQQGGAATLYAAACSHAPEEIVDIFLHIQHLRASDLSLGAAGQSGAATLAYRALLVSAVETSNLMASVAARGVLVRDRDACSLPALLQLTGRLSGVKPEAFVAHVVKHWVLLRHFEVVADRSSNGDGKNRFRFVLGDHGLERFNPAATMPVPAFAQDRLQHIAVLCEQAGLLESKDSQYRLTVSGRDRMAVGI